jgi:uncharacterized membrane protein YhaH (DUF805 family)
MAVPESACDSNALPYPPGGTLGEIIMKWLIAPWRRMFDFSGRATRREYWSFVGTFYAGMFLYFFLLGLLAPPPPGRGIDMSLSGVIGVVTILLLLFASIAGLSAAVRRVHDHDKTGWFILLGMIPAVGWIFFLFLMLASGTDGPNSYGSDPRDPHADMNEVVGIFA